MLGRMGISILVIMALALPLHETSAGQGPGCNFYDYQDDAQADFDRFSTTMPNTLDNDGNGIACDELPQRPEILAGMVRFRGNFAADAEYPTVTGSGYSNRYKVHLSYTRFAQSYDNDTVCGDLSTSKNLHELFALEGFARSFYAKVEIGTPPPLDESGQQVEFSGQVWTVLDDPANPVLLNEWLVRNGLLLHQTPVLAPENELSTQFLNAETSARAEGAGIWGACELPAMVASNTSAAPSGSVFYESGSGDQAFAFNLESPSTYRLVVDIYGGSAVFVAVDVYTADGAWLPELSVSSIEPGEFSSARYLDPGSYYIQVKAVGSWRVSIFPLVASGEQADIL